MTFFHVKKKKERKKGMQNAYPIAEKTGNLFWIFRTLASVPLDQISCNFCRSSRKSFVDFDA